MKKLKTKVLAATVLAAVSCSAQADFWVSGGSNSNSKTSMSIGFKGGSEWGMEIGIIYDAEYTGNLLDYPVPHSSYIDLGTKKTMNTLGLDIARFFEISPQVRAYGEVGMYAETKKHIAQSTVTGWYYTQEDQSSIVGAAGLGVQYVSSSGITVGAGFHSLRGPNISIGASY